MKTREIRVLRVFLLKVVGLTGLEPVTPRLSSACSNQLSYEPRENGRYRVRGPSLGGADRVRTGDPLLAKQMLYQLSYDPRPGLYSAVLKNISLLKFTLCDQSGPRRQQVLRPTASFDHRRDHLRDVAVSLERR